MQVLNIFHVLITITMIAFILVQKGAGATAGAAFGSGASGTVFGSRGAGNFLSRSTWVLATLFCLISLSMAVIASRGSMAPETDLGVVATTPVEEQTIDQAIPDIPIGLESADSSDVPSMDTVIAQPATEDSTGEVPVEDLSGGNLPEIEPAAETEEEPAAAGEGS